MTHEKYLVCYVYVRMRGARVFGIQMKWLYQLLFAEGLCPIVTELGAWRKTDRKILSKEYSALQMQNLVQYRIEGIKTEMVKMY